MPEMQGSEDQNLSSIFDEDVGPDPKDETLAELEGQIEHLHNKLYEERFIWVLVSVVLIDMYVFSQMQSWSGPLVIRILEIVGIVIMADRCKVDTVAPLIDKLTGFANNVTKGGSN